MPTKEEVEKAKATIEAAKEEERKARHARFQERLRVATKEREDLKQELGNEYDVLTHPKFEKCFGLAWEYGHSSGLHAVRDYFDELVELLK
jgi:hypothetical protein